MCHFTIAPTNMDYRGLEDYFPLEVCQLSKPLYPIISPSSLAVSFKTNSHSTNLYLQISGEASALTESLPYRNFSGSCDSTPIGKANSDRGVQKHMADFLLQQSICTVYCILSMYIYIQVICTLYKPGFLDVYIYIYIFLYLIYTCVYF